jgi:TIR domain/Tetratricopeptide repeat
MTSPEADPGALSAISATPLPAGGSAPYAWDFFLAHAGGDTDFAEALYEGLASKARVFLDSRVLLPGDDWDRELQQAQQESRVTVVLISAQTDEAYYAREEIAAAIELARHDGDRHRVVPIYLNGGTPRPIPYGLRLKHGLTVKSPTGPGVDELVTKLLFLKAQLDTRMGSTNRELGAIEPQKSGSRIYISRLINPPDGDDFIQARSTIWLAATGPETFIVDSITIEHSPGRITGGGRTGAVPPDAEYRFTVTNGSYRIHALEPALSLSPDDRREVSMTLGLSLEGFVPPLGYVTARLHYHTYEGDAGELLLRNVPEGMAELSRLLDADVRAYLDDRGDRMIVTPTGVQRGASALASDVVDFRYLRLQYPSDLKDYREYDQKYWIDHIVNASRGAVGFSDRDRINQIVAQRRATSAIVRELEGGKKLYFDLCAGLQDEESLAGLIRIAGSSESGFDQASRALAIRHLLRPSQVLADFVIQSLKEVNARAARPRTGWGQDPNWRSPSEYEPPYFYALLAAPAGEWFNALIGLLDPKNAKWIWQDLLRAFSLLGERLSDAERATIAAKQKEYAQLYKVAEEVERQIVLERLEYVPLKPRSGWGRFPDVAGRRRVLGAEHPDTLTAMADLAYLYNSWKDFARARKLGNQVIEVRRRVLGAEHPDTLTSMADLTSTLLAVRDFAAARQLGEEVLEARRRVLGGEHPDTLSSMASLALVLWAQGDLADARKLEEQVLEARRRLLGPQHSDTTLFEWHHLKLLQSLKDEAGSRKLRERLGWLLKAGEWTLSVDQRTIRQELRESLEPGIRPRFAEI